MQQLDAFFTAFALYKFLLENSDLSLIFHSIFKHQQQMLFAMPSFSVIGLNSSCSSVAFYILYVIMIAILLNSIVYINNASETK
jgi:hypothetical protein